MYLSDNKSAGLSRRLSLLLLAMILVPKGFSLNEAGNDHMASLTSIVNPLIMLALFFMVVVSAVFAKRIDLQEY